MAIRASANHASGVRKLHQVKVFHIAPFFTAQELPDQLSFRIAATPASVVPVPAANRARGFTGS
jgi:hypothetical protein